MSDLRILVPRIFHPDAVTTGFTTRSGGVSLPPFDSLNLGFHTADDPAAVRENHRILYNHIGIPDNRAALMGQIHGSNVRIVDESGLYPDTDALLTSRSGLLLGVRVADCVPMLVFDARKGVIGAVHCGWKPIVSGIVERTVETMRRTWDSDPSNIRAALGPSAGPCCYEIGIEVASRLSKHAIREHGGRLFADLRSEVVLRLGNAGIFTDRIEADAPCTICGESSFYSHRRDGARSGRMMGFIVLRRTSER